MSTKIAKPVRRLLDRAKKRFVRSRSGSVLILVVALTGADGADRNRLHDHGPV